MIASCSKDKTVIVWKVCTMNLLAQGGPLYFDPPIVEKMSVLELHQAEVWRVCWNILGTCLSSSGDDGCVRVWKKNIKNKFS